MSPLNVHVNRFPIWAGSDIFRHIPGEYLVALDDKSSLRNERTLIGVENGERKVLFKQIAGFVARTDRRRRQGGRSGRGGKAVRNDQVRIPRGRDRAARGIGPGESRGQNCGGGDGTCGRAVGPLTCPTLGHLHEDHTCRSPEPVHRPEHVLAASCRSSTASRGDFVSAVLVHHPGGGVRFPGRRHGAGSRNRRRNSACEIDSLSDVVSFGAAPAFLVYQMSLSALGGPGHSDQLAADGLRRTAAGPVQRPARRVRQRTISSGCRSPSAAITVASFTLNFYAPGTGLHPIAAAALPYWSSRLGLLMVSKVKYDTLPKVSTTGHQQGTLEIHLRPPRGRRRRGDRGKRDLSAPRALHPPRTDPVGVRYGPERLASPRGGSTTEEHSVEPTMHRYLTRRIRVPCISRRFGLPSVLPSWTRRGRRCSTPSRRSGSGDVGCPDGKIRGSEDRRRLRV